MYNFQLLENCLVGVVSVLTGLVLLKFPKDLKGYADCVQCSLQFLNPGHKVTQLRHRHNRKRFIDPLSQSEIIAVASAWL